MTDVNILCKLKWYTNSSCKNSPEFFYTDLDTHSCTKSISYTDRNTHTQRPEKQVPCHVYDAHLHVGIYESWAVLEEERNKTHKLDRLQQLPWLLSYCHVSSCVVKQTAEEGE